MTRVGRARNDPEMPASCACSGCTTVVHFKHAAVLVYCLDRKSIYVKSVDHEIRSSFILTINHPTLATLICRPQLYVKKQTEQLVENSSHVCSSLGFYRGQKCPKHAQECSSIFICVFMVQSVNWWMGENICCVNIDQPIDLKRTINWQSAKGNKEQMHYILF